MTDLEIIDDGIVIAHLDWANGRLSAFFVSDILKIAVDIWALHGIREWVPCEDGREMRITPPTDHEFPSRLALYIERQSGLRVRVPNPLTAR